MENPLLHIPRSSRRDFMKLGLTGLAGVVGAGFPMSIQGKEKTEEPDYFPIQQGNWWIYNAEAAQPFQYKVSVSGTEEIDGHTYSLFLYEGISKPLPLTIERLRKEDNNVFRYSPIADPTDKIFYKFDALEDEYWKTHYHCLVQMGKKDEIITIPAGTFENCMNINFIDCQAGEWFAPNVGLIKGEENPYSYSKYALECAYVNGNLIGVDSSVDEKNWKLYE